MKQFAPQKGLLTKLNGFQCDFSHAYREVFLRYVPEPKPEKIKMTNNDNRLCSSASFVIIGLMLALYNLVTVGWLAWMLWGLG